MKLDLYSDPGHAWLKVSKKLIKKLGIEDKITIYSYMRKDFVYLEEDCDLTLFEKEMKKIGKTVEFRHHHTDNTSRIRNYSSYQCKY